MIKGIPYWGSDTFNDIRELNKITDLVEKEILNINSIYDLFFELSKKNNIIRVKEGDRYFYSYVRDICFNYRDRIIFIPYWSYKEKKISYNAKDKQHLDYIDESNLVVRYEFCKLIDIIDNRQTKERKEFIEIYDVEDKELYKVSIQGLPYINEEVFSLNDLHKRYINSAYYYMDNEGFDFDNRYHKIDRQQGYNIEYRIRQQRCLKHWRKGLDDYSLLDYRDVRMYKYHDLTSNQKLIFTENKGYWERRYLFEAYIYCVFAANLQVQEKEYAVDFEKLGKSKRVVKYEENDISLFLKYYYKDYFVLNKLSYERYVKIVN